MRRASHPVSMKVQLYFLFVRAYVGRVVVVASRTIFAYDIRYNPRAGLHFFLLFVTAFDYALLKNSIFVRYIVYI